MKLAKDRMTLAMLTLLLGSLVATTVFAVNGSALASLTSVLGFTKGAPSEGTSPPPEGDTSGGPIDLGDIEPSEVFSGRFAINGVAMRDMRMGGINLSGPPSGSTVVKAYLYWQWICLDTPTRGRHDQLKFKQVFPFKTGGTVTGALVGVADQPCWVCPGAPNAYTYKADVTQFMSPSGGGTYGVVLKGNAPGSTRYTDPWGCEGGEPPYFEGAVLVCVYESSCEPNGFVAIYDRPLGNNMFRPQEDLMYRLVHPVIPGVLTDARFALAGADGQMGTGYDSAPDSGPEQVLVNGVLVSGPGSQYNDSVWNGASSKPLPGLFDVAGHDVTPLLEPGTTTTRIHHTGPGFDCLIQAVNVLSFSAPPQ